MSDEEKVDALIVGGGMAGLACAYLLSKAGKEVVVVERGEAAGAKALTGGRIYSYSLKKLLGAELFAEAPLERPIVKEQICITHPRGALTIDYMDQSFTENIPQSYSVLPSVFNPWLAEKVEENDAIIASGILVDGLIEKDGCIVGVRMGEEEMLADVVIAADGVNSFIAQQAGLREDLKGQEVAVGVKEIIELPEDVINSRFGVLNGEGAARLFLGVVPAGGGFLYTNKTSISLGLVAAPHALAEQDKPLTEMMQDLKMHPAVYPLIEGGTTVEYGAHLVAEGGYHALPKKLYREGMLVIGDAAGFCINIGTSIRGMDLAVASGIAAAEACLESENLAHAGEAYQRKLSEVILPTMKLYAGYPALMAMPRMYKEYPELAHHMMQAMFTVDGSVPEKLPKTMLNIVKHDIGFSNLLSDGWKGFKSV